MNAIDRLAARIEILKELAVLFKEQGAGTSERALLDEYIEGERRALENVAMARARNENEVKP